MFHVLGLRIGCFLLSFDLDYELRILIIVFVVGVNYAHDESMQ